MRLVSDPSDTLVVDTLSLVPGTVMLESGQIVGNDTVFTQLSASGYIILHAESRIIFTAPPPRLLRIRYTVFPYLFTRSYYRYDAATYDSTQVQLKPYQITAGAGPGYLDIDGLDYSGSFARGISFGNNQDVVVNSTFNLQMNGRLQNDVDISASITDNNIPIQPEGNTQQLQEFDRVFIKLSKGRQRLTMGDYEMYDNGGYFMQFYKKMQGAAYAGDYDLDNGALLETSLSAAVARGIHVRQQLSIIEGNQGPYKLKGNNGETFIIILAGTERVFMDGKQLTRGAEHDYVIDYNAGEITFMPRILITKDKRIMVEFEYADRQYFRTLVYSNNQYTSADRTLQVRMQVYSEQDSKNQPLDQSLGSAERDILNAAGDSVSTVFAPAVDSIAFDASRILYKMIDSLGFDSVFVYSIDPDSAFYALTFTELGLNRGNYIVSNSAANGKVYKWVAPIGGVPQGTAEPIVLLAAPRKAQMISVTTTYVPNERNSVQTEIALSQNDPNTFSVTGNGDNDGLALRTGWKHNLPVSGKNTLQIRGDYEFAGKQFSALERFRPVEFSRDWSIYNTERTHEHYANAGMQFASGEKAKAGYQSSMFIREGIYRGFLQTLTGQVHSGPWDLDLVASGLLAASDTLQTTFIRPKLTVSRSYPALTGFKTGVVYEGEHNLVSSPADSLVAQTFTFDQYTAYFSTGDSSDQTLRGDVIFRNDKVAAAGALALQTQAWAYQLQGVNRYARETGQLQWQLQYRTMRVPDTALTTLRPENTLLGRVQHLQTIRKGLLTSDILYEIGTGTEQQRSYTFVETEPGAGVYTWNDYNGNGAQELNEFEVAVFADQANYIQVFVPTDNYIQTNTTNFNYALSVNPKVLWHNAKGFEGFVGKFSAQSNLTMNRKVFDDQTVAAYNPFAVIADSLLVSSALYWVNTVFFNRSGSKFGMDYSYIRNFTKQVITVGPESRAKEEHKYTVRYRPDKYWTINGTVYNGIRQYTADAFTDRNYYVPYLTLEPKISYTLDTRFRITGTVQSTSAENREGGELLKSLNASVDLRYNIVTKSTVNAKVAFVQIDFSGDADTPVGYAMLEGLQNGNNLLWNLNIDRKLSQVLQLTAGYEGRKTGDNPITHIGRLQMRAVF